MASRYELVTIEHERVLQILKDARFSLHDDAYRELLRAISGSCWEQRARLDGVAVMPEEPEDDASRSEGGGLR
jgi:predicted alpha-1,6-mannanase (GH76 family)